MSIAPPTSPVQSASSPEIALPGEKRSDLFWLVLLLVLATGMRLWQVYNTEITSRDSIMYIRYAWRLEHEPWPQVFRTGVHHPGYGTLVYLVSEPLRALLPGDNLPHVMQLAAQLTAALCSILLVVPMYFLGRELFDRRVGFWGVLFFQVIPASGRLMADGLSEPMFLLLVSTALWMAVCALGTGQPIWFLLCGPCTGLSYLTRTEGLLVVLVTLVVLAGLQYSSRWRRSRGRLAGQAACLVAGCALVSGPFMVLIGGVSLKASAKYMLDSDGWKVPDKPADTPRITHVRMPLPLAKWKFGGDITPEDRYLWAARTVVEMVDKAFFHIFFYPTLLGLWLFRRRFAEVPGMWVLLVAGVLLVPLLYRLGQSNGYISERHAILLVVGGVFWAAAALGVVASWLARLVPRYSVPILSLVLLVVMTGVCMPRTLARLHGNRTGFREVGAWIAENTMPGDEVFDPMTWTAYYAGRVFVEGRTDLPRSDPPVCYVVLEKSNNWHPHLRYLLDPAEKLAARGTLCHTLPVRRGKEEVEIQVYKVNGTP